MDRRKFTYAMAGTMASLGIPKSRFYSKETKTLTLKKPNKLEKGDKVGLISPGSPITDEKMETAKKNMEALGLVPIFGQHVMNEYGYLAGTDIERISDIHLMFQDEDIKAVWAIRGGYGCTRIMDKLDYDLIRKHPKHFIGYSDLTALHLSILKETGLACTHGPVAGTAFSQYTFDHIESVLFKQKKVKINLSEENVDVGKTHTLYKSQIYKSGKAKGRLIGGNLSLLASLAGTDYAPDYTDKLVFIEDVGEKPYRIDRMLTQLIQSGNLLKASGIILGVFAGCNPDEDDKSLSLSACLQDRFANFEGPVVYGFSFGHIKNQCSFQYGIKATLDTDKFRVTF